ncbi:glycosyltransferase family 4 protein [Mucilaginibacter sp. UR6-1]|uniref:glycosyltransferase family 4 protein n=1 Tax=Mucilaginibacter sp. UR6-1 TaxID=1435643 RepID=UPI001E3DDCDF|nr:glycosyltransferase family 4 protein [Mucilaginibacter sp. UR6-1]MCC8411158.1 glycosyltransferase family 4 protein [Mucilaginibacter sp. UR6-1]
MKILILTHRALFPQNGGYPIVVYNTIKGLLALGHTVTLISLDEKQVTDRHYEADNILDSITYRHCSVNTDIGFFKAFISLFTAAVPFIDKYFDERADKVLADELRNNNYDIVQFEGLFVTPYLNTVKKHSKAKILYRAHNIEHQVWQRIAQRKADPFKKIYLLLLAKRIKAFEINQLSRFDGIIAFTDQDKNAMIGYGTKAPVEILPISIELNKYQPCTEKTEFPSLFFLGSLGWMPNLEGIEWFIDNFHADLTEGDLRVRFYLAGNDIPETFDDYEVPGKIYIQGEVDDALEFVNSKAIMIVPLLSGGGMRVKIVEGMAMQKCIISTSLGAEGIDYTHGQNIIIANTRTEFFNAIKRCIADEHYCRRIGENARQLVEERHNVTAVTTRLIGYYSQLLKA